MLRFASKTSHQINGSVEAVHGHIQGLARCYQTQIETNTGVQLSAFSLSNPFAICDAGFVVSRFTVRPDGRTPFQYLLGTPYVTFLCMIGESVFALIPDHELRAANLTNRWISGSWRGRDASSDEHLVGTKHCCLNADQFAENHLGINGVDVKRLKLILHESYENEGDWQSRPLQNFLETLVPKLLNEDGKMIDTGQIIITQKLQICKNDINATTVSWRQPVTSVDRYIT